MVGFVHSSITEKKEEELKPQSLSDSNKPHDDSGGLCIPELEDFSTDFCDSFFDFDPIDDLFKGEKDMDIADFGKDEFGLLNESLDDIFNGEVKPVEGGVETGFSQEIKPVEVGEKMADLGNLIEEKLGKVSLDSAMNLSESAGDVAVKIDKAEVVKSSDKAKNEDESESESDAESESDSSSSSSSSSSDDDDDEEEDEIEKGIIGGKKKFSNDKEIVKGEADMEEGEIMLSDEDEMFSWTDNDEADDESGIKGPIKSKNEVKVLPPVPIVTVTLEPHHQTLPVGVILSILGTQVIVEGVEKHNPLNESSILWITETRSPLGIIDEIFGPVKNPYYIVRYNTESEVPIGIQQGTSISFVQEFADHVLNNKNLYQKGYDVSGENDEEISEELEFSDDEKEAEYKRMLKMKKRGTDNSKKPAKRNDKRQFKNQNGNQNNNTQASQNHSLANDRAMGQPFQPPAQQSYAPNGNWNNGNQNRNNTTQNHPFSSVPPQGGANNGPMLQGVPNNGPMAQPFQAPVHGFGAPNGIWNNGFPLQMPQNMGLPNGLPANTMPWMQQGQQPFVPQQQMGTMPGFPGNFNSFNGMQNIGGPPGFAPWPVGLDQNMLNQLQFGMGIQAQQGSMPVNAVGEQPVQSQGFQTNHNFEPSSANSGTPSNFNRGRGGPGPRGGGRRGNRGGGRRGGGRGRNQFN